jgi:hypothetical protein
MDITRGRLSLQEAFDRMDTWYQNLTAKVEGDPIDLQKGQQKILEFLQRDVMGPKKRPLPIGWDRNLNDDQKKMVDLIFKPEHTEWPREKLIQHFHSKMEEHPDPNSSKRYEVVEYMIERLSRSPSLTSLDREVVLNYISKVCQMPGVTTANLKKRMTEIQSGGIAGTDHTSIAKAVITHLEQFGELRFHHSEFWQWKGSNWEPLNESIILKHIAEEFGELAAAKKHSDHRGIINVMRALLPQEITEMNLRGANFANYFLTFEGEKLPHAPALGATFTLPYRHSPEIAGHTPLFFKFLENSWGKDDDFEQKLDALQEMMCATIFGLGTVYQRSCLLFGRAGSGKSQLMEIVKAFFPAEAIAVVPPDQWGDKFAPTMLAGKFLNVAGELSEKRTIDGKAFKEMIDGSEIIGQKKGGQLFKFIPKCIHWFGGNFLPKSVDSSTGFTRRWLILRFNRVIPLDEKILGVSTKIIAQEREAIAAWAVEAAPRLLKHKDFTLPPSHTQWSDEMAAENNTVRAFVQSDARVMTPWKFNKIKDQAGAKAIEALLERSLASPTLDDVVFSEYQAFSFGAGGSKPLGIKKFRMALFEMQEDFGFHVNGKCDDVQTYNNLVLLPIRNVYN